MLIEFNYENETIDRSEEERKKGIRSAIIQTLCTSELLSVVKSWKTEFNIYTVLLLNYTFFIVP